MSTRHSIEFVHGDAKDLSLLYEDVTNGTIMLLSRVLIVINKLSFYVQKKSTSTAVNDQVNPHLYGR